MSTPLENPNILSNLPPLVTHLTGHNASTLPPQAVVQESRPATWTRHDDMAFSVMYTTSQFPADLNADADIAAHDAVTARGLGLVNPNGTVCRVVDFAPGFTCAMHRTRSLDYGIVLEGTIHLVLDDGSETAMTRGHVAVQRATNHAWRNPSATEWARMIFVLQECKEVEVGGKVLGADDHLWVVEGEEAKK